MRPEELDPGTLENRRVGPITVLFGYENGKYPYGNSFLVEGEEQSVMIDPCLGVVARRDALPKVDMVIHSHTHEDHIAGTHLFSDVPWYAHSEDALGLKSIDGLMDIYGLPPGETYDAFLAEIDSAFYYPHEGSSAGAVRTFEEGHSFDLGGVTIDVLHTPGHTRGHSCFLVSWGDSREERFVYLGDIELTGFGPYYGDAWSNLKDFESSMRRLKEVDAHWWLTFHHKGLIEGRETFLAMLEKFSAMIDDRESRLLDYIVAPRTLDEIVEHRFVYRPGQTGFLIDMTERRSMLQHLERLMASGVVALTNDHYQVVRARRT
ncbi:MAG: MBL fold metallo-hydrolase [Pseudomonadales bacterium]|nr:MBL fold metallo-hydrolase [Pseudomonadales bacterium]MBO7005685.1 MBL fold metallo-hydrolase [Pseudomonadales bacterium]